MGTSPCQRSGCDRPGREVGRRTVPLRPFPDGLCADPRGQRLGGVGEPLRPGKATASQSARAHASQSVRVASGLVRGAAGSSRRALTESERPHGAGDLRSASGARMTTVHGELRRYAGTMQLENRSRRTVSLSLLGTALAVLAVPVAAAQAAGSTAGAFEVRFDAQRFDEDFHGDLFVAFAEQGEPRQAMHGWFGAPPVLRFRIEGAAPGSVVTLRAEDAVASAPRDWSAVPAQAWRVQAIARVSRTGRLAGHGEGDVYGSVAAIDYDPASDAAVALTLDVVSGPPEFQETDRVRLFEFRSPALSEFHGFDYTLRAGVLLPKNYGDQESYPVVYSVTGFGGTHSSVHGWSQRIRRPGSELDQLPSWWCPTPPTSTGTRCSATPPAIGPWGEALVREMIPALEEDLRRRRRRSTAT